MEYLQKLISMEKKAIIHLSIWKIPHITNMHCNLIYTNVYKKKIRFEDEVNPVISIYTKLWVVPMLHI